jgi:hypothetical protein
VATEKRNGMSLPAGILAATSPEPADEPGQGGPAGAPAEAKASRKRARRAATATGADESDHGAKLHLTPDVRFRLRMLAYQRGRSLSAVANDLLDKALPKWTLERTE